MALNDKPLLTCSEGNGIQAWACKSGWKCVCAHIGGCGECGVSSRVSVHWLSSSRFLTGLTRCTMVKQPQEQINMQFFLHSFFAHWVSQIVHSLVFPRFFHYYSDVMCMKVGALDIQLRCLDLWTYRKRLWWIISCSLEGSFSGLQKFHVVKGSHGVFEKTGKIRQCFIHPEWNISVLQQETSEYISKDKTVV